MAPGFSNGLLMFVLLYLGLQLPKNGQCLLAIKPQNAAALSGDVVTLSCASNSEDSVAWVAYSPGSSEREYIFGGRDLFPSASLYISISRHGRGHYSLHINATSRAAKRYICVEQGSTMTASAELIILESNTECLTKVTDAFVNMSCSVRFAGNWAPTMEWRTNEGHKLGVEDGVQIHSQSDIVTSNLFQPLIRITEYSQFKLNVITNFNESGKPQQASATNVPEYNHTISPYSSGFEYINVTQTVETKEKPTVVVLLICTVVFLAAINIAFILKAVRFSLGQTTFLRKMALNLSLILFYLSFQLPKHAQCALSITPQNTVAISGETVILSCASDSEDSVAWAAYSPGSSEREYIFSRHILSPNFSSYISFSEEKRGHCSLKIRSTREAAKRYICVEQDSATTASAELIVLENNPECQFKLTAVSVNITCSVEFFGNWAPIMEWKIGESQDLEIKQYSSDTGLVLSNLSLPLNSSNIDPACQLNIVTRFSEFGRPKEASATNVPGYNHTNSPSRAECTAMRNAGHTGIRNADHIVVNLTAVVVFILMKFHSAILH